MSIKDGKRGLLSSVNHSLNKSLEDRKTQPHFIVQSLIHTHTTTENGILVTRLGGNVQILPQIMFPLVCYAWQLALSLTL